VFMKSDINHINFYWNK